MSRFALVDCNNFYCSCERVFQPSLNGKPVIVLSNNDGCAISRSEEAKSLGIKMGEPLFKIKDLVRRHDVKVFSSNYALYGDMSRRVMETLSSFTPHMEVYSIDEAFLRLTRDDDGVVPLGRKIRATVKQWTGIPVCIGIGSTKVRAKIANRWAKKHPETGGVFDVESGKDMLKSFPVEDIWGIGSQSAKKLNRLGILTALDLKDASPDLIRNTMGVVGERIVRELNGVSCLSLEEVAQPRKNITCSRSFGVPLETLEAIEEALASFVACAAEKLRQQHSCASIVGVYLTTNPHRKDIPQHEARAICRLTIPTSHTPTLISQATRCLKSIFKHGLVYKKTGIDLSGLVPEKTASGDLFEHPIDDKGLMKTIDSLNRQMGRDVIRFGSTGLDRKWKLNADYSSSRYTTRWNELLKISLR